MTKQAFSVRNLCLMALFTAIISVLAQISIPMPYGVPMTLQTFAIPLAGIILGSKRGGLSTLIYVLLGAVGVPVFTNFMGGLGVVFGPTGGFILSFPIMGFMAGLGSDRESKAWMWLGLVVGAVINFACGMLLFSVVMSKSLAVAFTACVLPFIPTAIAKIMLAGLLGTKIRAALQKGGIML